MRTLSHIISCKLPQRKKTLEGFVLQTRDFLTLAATIVLARITMADESDALFAEGQDRMTPEGNPWQQQPKHRGAKKGFSNSVFGLLAVALPLGLVCGYANILFLVSFVAAGVLLGYARGCLQLMIDKVMFFGYGEAGHDGMPPAMARSEITAPHSIDSPVRIRRLMQTARQ